VGGVERTLLDAQDDVARFDEGSGTGVDKQPCASYKRRIHLALVRPVAGQKSPQGVFHHIGELIGGDQLFDIRSIEQAKEHRPGCRLSPGGASVAPALSIGNSLSASTFFSRDTSGV